MIVHFGLHLDGITPAPPCTASGVLTAGPARLLDLLELQLGLPSAPVRPGEAVIAYQGCLEDLDSPDRFYHQSMRVDPIGVARTLLTWRAAWYEAGWRGRFDGAVPRRLADLAAVERLAAERVPPNAGQRLLRIAAALDEGLRTQIGRIVLHDDPLALPAAWRAVLAHFDCETAAGVPPAAHAAPGTDLARIQHALLALDREAGERGAEPLERIRLDGDDSLLVLRGGSRDVSAQALGEFLRAADPADDVVLIAERDGIIVDNALERVGLPRVGFQHYSRFRAVTQVVKLALSLVWKPLGPRLLLQFLLHPVGPLPGRVRSALAEAVAEEPGVGGRAWRAALDALVEREHADAAAAGRDDAAARVERMLADVQHWLECERYAAHEGAPISVLTERVQRCATWLARRLRGAAGSEQDLYAAALAQSEALLDALARLAERGTLRVPRLMLERLVDEVTSGSPDPATFAESAHVRAATAPDTITRVCETVIWWDVAAQPQRVEPPWSDAEIEALRAQGVALPAPAEVIRMRTRGWLRPVLNARRRLILVVHDHDEGRHPLWSRLTSIAAGFNEVHVEDALLAGAEIIPALHVPLEPLERRPLPERRRWWLLPAEARLAPRPVESYSSLVKLLYHPHQWVLRYAARLTPGRAGNLASGGLLYGKLAHRLFEMYFERWPNGVLPAGGDPELGAWLARTLPSIIETEGAVLDEPGMGVTRERIVVTLTGALHALLDHLRDADIVRVTAEAQHHAPFTAGGAAAQIRGAIDLLLTDARGAETVVDVKWGGLDWRGAEIAENRALQLATYAYLRSRPDAAHRWPAQAYFIVSTGDIVAADARVFPRAVTFAPELPETAEQTWRRLLETYGWRRAQLDAGAIELNVAGTEPDERSFAPSAALKTPVNPDNFDDYAALTGWEPGE